MTKVDEQTRRLKASELQKDIALKRYGAAALLHEAAVAAGDGVEAQKQRDVAHAQVDLIFDSAETVQTLLAEIRRDMGG